MHGVRVVDVVAGRSTEPQTVSLRRGLIEAMQPDGEAWDGEPAINGRGRWLAPGLIDGHVHLFLDGGYDPVGTFLAADVDRRREVAARNARRALAAGITTVRDLGAPPGEVAELSAAIERGELVGPSVVHAGAPVTRPAGHLSWLDRGVDGIREARALVSAQLAAGASVVKLVCSGGGLTPGTRPDRAELPVAVIRAAVEIARERGAGVAAHCHASTAMRRALAARVDTIEHASFLVPRGRVRFDPDLALEVRDAGIAVVPTAAGALRTAARYRAAGAHNPADTGAIERLEARRWIAGELQALGVPIVAGTDAGATDTPFDALHEELTVYASIGLSAPDALRTATSTAARYLGLADRGEIAVGRRADLLLLDADPLIDRSTLARPLAVFIGGRQVGLSPGASRSRRGF
ncbi:MAG TPA: amidohydrolase family protein [Candidatus Limnocylindrales bacterium]|nr:amidohydrolase family protein [Candidatus Limnocylindrales bacterium]